MKLWEIRRRREYLDKREARKYLHQLRVVNAGFNGGESSARFQQELHRNAFPPIVTLEDKKKPPRNWIKDLLNKIYKES